MKRLSLARPNAVVTVPRTLQAGLLGLGLLSTAGCLAGLAPWFAGSMAFGARHAALAGVALVLLVLLARPATWRPWVRAAADPYGVYLRGRGRWHCVRWRHVHAIDVSARAVAGDAREEAPGSRDTERLVLRALLPEAERQALAPGSWVHHGVGGDASALRLVVPGTDRDPERYRNAFESVRPAA